MKILFSTIKMFQIYLEEDVCLYRPNAPNEKERRSGQRLSEDHSWRTAENSCLSKPESKKSNWNFKQDWVLRSDETKKLAF